MRSRRKSDVGGLNSEELTTLICLLRKLKQPWNRAIMELMASHLPVITIEAVILREHQGRQQVLLTFREGEPGDPWPKVWHLPGTVIRILDGGWKGALLRLIRDEVGGEPGPARFSYARWHEGGGRPLTYQQVYRVRVNKHTNGTWFDVDDLPDGLIGLHRDVILPHVLGRHTDPAAVS